MSVMKDFIIVNKFVLTILVRILVNAILVVNLILMVVLVLVSYLNHTTYRTIDVLYKYIC